MDSYLEQILKKLLVPDTSVIAQATYEISEALKNPQTCTSLANICCSSEIPQIRQYAAILLRRKLSKKRHWKNFPDAFRLSLKQKIIERLIAENQKIVRNAIAELAGMIAKYELPEGTWPELFVFILEHLKSSDPNSREFGMSIFSIIVKSSGTKMQQHLPHLLNVIPSVLNESNSKDTIFYAIKTLSSLVPLIHVNEMSLFHTLYPKVLNVMKAYVYQDEEQAIELMEFFDEVFESEVSLVDPFIKPTMDMFFEIISAPSCVCSIKIKTLTLLGLLVELKSNCILIQNMIEPSLKIVFPVMCTPLTEKVNGMSDDDEDSYELISAASQVLDMMALNLPPEKVIPPLLTFLEPALQSENPFQKKAAYLAIGVISEGCSEFIRTKYLKPLLQCICKGVNDSNPIVKKSAFFTLEQFAEYLKPDFNKLASELLPPFVDFLLISCRNFRETSRQIKDLITAFNQFQAFCSNLDSALAPYLPTLMEQLFSMYMSSKSSQVKLMMLTIFGSLVSAGKKDILPYVSPLIEIIKTYLMGKDDDDSMLLEIQAVETLSMLANVLESKHFGQLTQECLIYSLKTLSKTSDSDLKRSIYDLLASISEILKENLGQFLPEIIPHLIRSLKVDPFEKTKNPTLANIPFPVFDLEDDPQEKHSSDESSEDDSDDWYTFNASNVQEKIEACKTIQAMAYNAPRSFLPFFHDCAVETKQMIFVSDESMRMAGIKATIQLSFVLLHNYENLKRKEDLPEFLEQLIQELLRICQSDLFKHIVICALEGLTILFTDCIKILYGKLQVETVMNVIFQLLTEQANCQKKTVANLQEISRAEYDILLYEYTGCLIPLLAKIIQREQFYPYFVNYLTLITKKLEPNRTEAERSFSSGNLAECCLNMEENVKPFANPILQAFLSVVQDKDEEVRSNAIYGIGVLMEHSKEILHDKYPNVLQVLSIILSKETNNRVKDNICATVARMIFTNINGVPVDQVFPVLMQNLPLKEDFEENFAIFRTIEFMLNNGHPQVYQHLGNIFQLCAHAVAQENFFGAQEQEVVMKLLNRIQKDYSSDFQAAMSSMPPELTEKLKLTIK